MGEQTFELTIEAALNELARFKRSIGQSDMERDLLAIRISTKLRAWRSRYQQERLTGKERKDIFATLEEMRLFNVSRVRQWCQEHSHRDRNLFTDVLCDAGVTSYMELAYILHALDNICTHCFDAPAGSQCWNDK